MNFFEHQEYARRSTRWMLMLFLLAVITLIIFTDLFVILMIFILELEAYSSLAEIPHEVHITVAISILIVVLLASLHRISELNGGGKCVLEEMNGRLVLPTTTNLAEKRLINVVEEMAIASGVSVPQVYLLNDSAINAFAAGYTLHDAVIGVTTGTIELLNREELQGVIAHEFSHILNGDMRINLRLIGILYGILFIGLIGQKIIRVISESREGGRFIFLGIGLVIIGYSGLFLGNLIKSMICLQREFLADASSVQFTRNPQGVSGALKKIGGWVYGSKVRYSNASEYSHFYIAEGVRSFFSTHPPLDERIKRLDPSWDGSYPKVIRKEQLNIDSEVKDKKEAGSFLLEPTSIISAAAISKVLASTGELTPAHIQYAETLIASVPDSLLQASHEPMAAYALVLGLLIHKDESIRKTQIEKIEKDLDDNVKSHFLILLKELEKLDLKFRLPLIELALPSLKCLSNKQLKKLRENLITIIVSDGKVDLREWSLFQIIILLFDKPGSKNVKYSKFEEINNDCIIILAALVYSAKLTIEDAKVAFYGAASQLGVSTDLPSEDSIKIETLDQAVENLRKLKPVLKFRFLKSLCMAAEHDGIVSAEEFELIRAIAENLDCPIPLSLFVTLNQKT